MTYDYIAQDVDWSSNNQYIVVASGSSAEIVSIPSGQEVASIEHDQFVTDVLWSPDGQHVASANAVNRPVVKVLQVQN